MPLTGGYEANPGAVSALDGVWATDYILASYTTKTTDAIYNSVFGDVSGFSRIPPYTIVKGIQFDIYLAYVYQGGAPSNTKLNVYATTYPNGVVVPTSQWTNIPAVSNTAVFSTTPNSPPCKKSWGNSSFLWGRNWTVAEMQSFGVHTFDSVTTSFIGTATMGIDFINITVWSRQLYPSLISNTCGAGTGVYTCSCGFARNSTNISGLSWVNASEPRMLSATPPLWRNTTNTSQMIQCIPSVSILPRAESYFSGGYIQNGYCVHTLDYFTIAWNGVDSTVFGAYPVSLFPFYFINCNDTTTSYPPAYTGYCYQRRFVMVRECVQTVPGDCSSCLYCSDSYELAGFNTTGVPWVRACLARAPPTVTCLAVVYTLLPLETLAANISYSCTFADNGYLNGTVSYTIPNTNSFLVRSITMISPVAVPRRHQPRYYDVTNPSTMTSLIPLL